MSGILAALAGIKTAIATAVDEYFNRTTLLLNTSSTNGAQNNTFLDSSTNNFTITRNGNTTQGTFTPFSQTGWSNYFNGSSTFSFASNAALNILAYDTFECWVNMSVLGTSDLIAGRDAAYWMGYNHTGIGGTANKFVFAIYNGSSWQAVSSTTTPVVGTWYHILGVKDNTTMRFYVNGVQENTATFSGSPATGSTFYVASNNNTENLEGYVSNLRLITGASNTVFPYSGLTTGSSFTPPTSALTAVTGTALLTCQSNRFVDNSSNNLSATITSIPSVQAFSPFAPTVAYDPAVVGGSAYFDGSGDYLVTPSDAAFNLSSGDWTIEGWVYLNSNSDDTRLFTVVNSSTDMYGSYVRSGTVYIGKIGFSEVAFSTIRLNSWNHIAFCKTSTSTITCYINGASAGSTTTYTLPNANCTVYVAASPANYALSSTNGYISNFRIVKGTAVYTSTFTPPTAPLTAITNTSLLLSATNSGIYDSTAKNVLETVGNAQVSTTQAKWGTTSMYFDGTGDWLVMPSSQNFAFGTGNFTVEFWVYYSSASASYQFIDARGASYTNGGFALYTTGGSIYVQYGTSALVTATAPSANTWHHIAATRSGTSTKLFIDGTQAGSTATDSNSYGAYQTFIGQFGGGSGYDLNGYIDDLRVTKGYARYTANFSVPTAAFGTQ